MISAMSHALFLSDWIDTLCEALNASETYRDKGSGWKYPIVFRMYDLEADDEERLVYLDLKKGHCEEARVGTEEDIKNVSYVISGSEEHWLKLFNGQMEAVPALMQGKLKLQKGSMFSLISHTAAAQALLEVAISIHEREVEAGGSGSDEEGNEAPEEPGGAAATGDHAPKKEFKTVRGRLDFDSFPMKLYQKAKKLGVWDPADIEFEQDRSDWLQLSDTEQDLVLHLTSLFQAGEEAVTTDIVPLITVIAKEGRVEEELFLTSFLWEEGKHTEFFQRFLTDVARTESDLSEYYSPGYETLFSQKLPAAMNRLMTDPSPIAQLEASVTYNMVVEGMLAETGYHAYANMLERNGLMPGMLQGVEYLKRDESRHIAYGIHLISRLIAEDPSLWQRTQKLMSDLIPLVLQIINEIFDRYEQVPFGLEKETFIDFAMKQSDHRLNKLEQAAESGQPA